MIFSLSKCQNNIKHVCLDRVLNLFWLDYLLSIWCHWSWLMKIRHNGLNPAGWWNNQIFPISSIFGATAHTRHSHAILKTARPFTEKGCVSVTFLMPTLLHEFYARCCVGLPQILLTVWHLAVCVFIKHSVLLLRETPAPNSAQLQFAGWPAL